MKTTARLLAALAVALAPAHALAWGKTGHRVTGALAQRYLTPCAAEGVKRILGAETLAEASTYPDDMRPSPDPFWRQQAGHYHDVVSPTGGTYAGAPPEGDAVTGLAAFAATVKDEGAPMTDRQLALRFIVHIVGDLHNPLHAGNGRDNGGRDVKVVFAGRPTDLHAVWDYGLIDERQLSYTELDSWLAARITPAQARDWRNTDSRQWIAESAELRERIYPTSDAPLGGAYIFAMRPLVDARLQQGGVRLAAYLNALFRGEARPSCRP
ncbi:S1/P1 nuclease [Caulobacter sp.]|uniref:S1/P1 nuclease n=1 Tax=Caulobacter sp. TaxID=78 RepID=UPI003BAF177A